MTSDPQKNDLVRDDLASQAREVGYVELFFDLIFVFAMTRLSHMLLADLTLVGMVQCGLLVGAIWWIWSDTSWVTNWLDPEKSAVRIAIFILMAAGLLMSTAIEEAFGDRGLIFALTLAFIQVGRSLFALWVAWGDEDRRGNFLRITVWAVATAAVWVAGGVLAGEVRMGVWAVGLALMFVAPVVGYVVPGLGRSKAAEWDIEGAHIAERVGLFIIICLGESVLVTGETFATLDWNPEIIAGFAVAFTTTLAMWWLFFSEAHEAASERVAEMEHPGRVARRAFTYSPILAVAGILVTAVGDELVLEHALGETAVTTALMVSGGPVLFLLGTLLSSLSVWRRLVWPRIAAMAVISAAGVGAVLGLPPLILSMIACSTLIATALWEHFAGHLGEA